jgi:AraC-like DNA-binding protein
MVKKTLGSKAKDFITDVRDSDLNYLTVNWVARKLGVSVSHLSRTFKAEKEISIHEFIAMEKYYRCCLLLMKNKKLTVKELVVLIDCCSASYFIRNFKELYGISPAKFRDTMTTHRKPKGRRKGSKNNDIKKTKK